MLIDFSADPRKAYGLMASAIAPRPIAWVCTQSKDGVVNLAPFSFFQMVTGTPPTLMISPLLQSDGSLKDTTRNIIETGEFVVNLVSHGMREKMNETSFSFPASVSEIEQCGIATLPAKRVQVPRVAGVPVSLECRVASVLPYPADKPSCHIILGEVLIAHIDDGVLDEHGRIDPRRLDLISRMGGDWYGRINSDDNFQMTRPQGWDKPSTTPHRVPPAMAEAVRLHAAARFVEAEVIYQQILAADPAQPDASGMLGWLMHQTGKRQQGLQMMQQAVDALPRNAVLLRNLGAALREEGALDEAIAYSTKALQSEPRFAEAQFDLAECYRIQNKLADAERVYQDAVRSKPDYVEAWVHLGLVQQLQRKFELAETSIVKALELNPSLANAQMNLAVLYHAQDKLEQAIGTYRHALQLDPQMMTAHYNLSVALRDIGRREEAEASCRYALALDPEYVDAHFLLAALLLQKGDFAQGWREYEYRWLLRTAKKIYQPIVPMWDGVADLRDKTILLHVEQGLGDTLQFARYAKLLAERGARAWMAVPESLRTLMQRCVGVSAVFCGPDELPPGLDYHAPMMSLPLLFKTELATIPADVPYLSCDPVISRTWGQRVGAAQALRVGLVWAGGLHNDADMGYAIDRLRSLHFEQLKPLLEIGGIEFFSLQLGEEARAQLAQHPQVHDYTGLIQDFHDTAALIEHLDLVISVDTSVAHLAGALGKPVWMLNRFNSCWRWLLNRKDSPWYPTMRIFQQPSFGDWNSVINDVMRELRQLVAVPERDVDPAILVVMQEALTHHQAGRLAQAEALYRQILDEQPRHADALHYLGMLAHQSGKQQEAIDLIRQAIAIDSGNPLYPYNLGTLYRQSGELAAAISSYQQAVTLKDNFTDAYYKLGISQQQARQLPEAEASYRQTIALAADHAGAHNNLGSVLQDVGRIAEAEASYRQALRIKPDFADAYLNFGNLLKGNGNLRDAEMNYRMALELQPQDAKAHSNLGVLLVQQERFEEAEQSYRQALALQPDSVEIHSNLGFAMVEQYRFAEAEQYFRGALRLQPEFAEAYNNLGIVLREQGKFDEAESAFRKALALLPTLLLAYNHLGNLFKQQHRYDEAYAMYAEAIEVDPNFAPAHSNLGVLLQEQSRPAEAEAHLRRALQIDPDFAFAHHNLSIVLRDQGRLAESEASCVRALELDPEHHDAQFHRSFLFLQKGDFVNGWRQFEYRWQLESAIHALDLSEPLWDGQVDIAGKKILLYAEQGYGDTLQMCRYARLVAARGATVLLIVPQELVSLMARCVGVHTAFSAKAEIPTQYDYQIPLMSLPLAFGTELETIPADVPYLSCDPALLHKWSVQIGERKGLRVGLVWAGNPRKNVPGGPIVDRQRSLHFELLKPLLDIDGIEFFSLQLGEEARAQLAQHPQVHDYTGLIEDFHDTAALIDHLDLVISVDTSVAHLAGALGKPVWMLNRFNSCWRWLLNRKDSPWYPSMRIFQQPSFGDWNGAIGDVAHALHELVAAPEREVDPAIPSMMQEALMHHQAGRLPQAEGLYRQILGQQPRHADALHYLGMLAHQSGRPQEAIDLIRQAIAIDSSNPLYPYNLGTLYRQSGDLATAIASYQQAVALKDNFTDAYYKLGISQQQARQLPEAETSYRQTIALASDHAGAHNNLGSVLQDMGRIAEAEASYRQALRIKPDFADAYLNFGNLLKDNGSLRDAEMNYRMALELQPQDAKVHSNLGVLLVQQERFEEAEQSYRQALALQPDSIEIHSNLGFAMVEQHRFAEAEQYFRGALRLQPEFAEAYNNLGIVLREQGKFDEAETAFRTALQLNPAVENAYSNLGNLRREAGKLEQAEASYLAALRINPNFHDARLNYAFALLQRGEFLLGWEQYESRWASRGFEQPHTYAQPMWDGIADLRGKAILIHAEQGFGDTLQFVRYAALLQQRGAVVYALVPVSMKSLLSNYDAITLVIVPGDMLPPFDWHCPMMSLPRVLKTEVASIPHKIPYLAASQISVERWRKLLGKKTALRVGLVWAGSPRKGQPAAQLIDRQRSMHFDTIKPLLQVPNVQCISLQLGDDARAQIDGKAPLRDVSGELRDFEETAALIANLDLVISVDTAVAHLAGALGKPVWLLNRYNTCWRWFSERSDSPWYPTMRIFRQPRMGDWPSVIADVQSALEQLVKIDASLNPDVNASATQTRAKRKKKR
jgi:tetratricopeptide (TPR) repeat protein/flavin reductase (DIM6/NTAB) family NADH-FMN oxidoreductase RutF